MKTTIIRHLLFAGVASVLTFSSWSQSASPQQTAFSQDNARMENSIYRTTELPVLKNYVTNEKANRKINRYLSKHFENAGNLTLGKVDDNVLAEYVGSDIKNKMLFDKNGNLIYTIAYGNEKMLPGNYREMIDNLYPDYKINLVAKVNEASREIWVLKIETPRRFLSVRIENDQPEEVERFQKPR